jgi:chloramphenicol O-acetyltransferase
MSDLYFNYIAKEKCHNLNNPTSCVNIVSQSMNTKNYRYKDIFFFSVLWNITKCEFCQ